MEDDVLVEDGRNESDQVTMKSTQTISALNLIPQHIVETLLSRTSSK